MSTFKTIKTPIGLLTLVTNEEGLEAIQFGKSQFSNQIESKKAERHLKQACEQLEEYFEGKRTKFNLKLAPKHGTSFQKAVWSALCQIPYGKTRSYGEIAKFIGKPKAARAVGMANNRNPISIVVPCHRVIGHSGDLVGFGGGLKTKSKLLQLEGAL